MPILLIILFHVCLWREFYFGNRYRYASGEVFEQGFSSFIHLGRGGRDVYYYPDFKSLPFLGYYYPPQRILSWIASRCSSLNLSWTLYMGMMVLHFLMSSLAVWGFLRVLKYQPYPSLLGSLTLSAIGYAMKPNASIICTAAWAPIFLLACKTHWWGISGISMGMMLLAGYWPIALYAIPLGCLLWLLG